MFGLSPQPLRHDLKRWVCTYFQHAYSKLDVAAGALAGVLPQVRMLVADSSACLIGRFGQWGNVRV